LFLVFETVYTTSVNRLKEMDDWLHLWSSYGFYWENES